MVVRAETNDEVGFVDPCLMFHVASVEDGPDKELEMGRAGESVEVLISITFVTSFDRLKTSG